MSMLSWAYVQCKNPECRNEFAAPFGTAIRLSFGAPKARELACPFCRASATYETADYHAARPHAPTPEPTDAPA